MSIITFWSNGKEQTGKTLSIVALATQMAIEHNYKILVISTEYKDRVLNNCFWDERVARKRNLGLFGPNTSVYLGNGIEGIIPLMRSRRLTPEVITNYTKIVFKDRLEILPSFNGIEPEYHEAKMMFPEIINMADKYYDMVLVDLTQKIGEDSVNSILQQSSVIVACLSQRLTSINDFKELREKKPAFKGPKVLISIGRYDKNSKYTIKNISRYLKERNKVLAVPYNTRFFEACEEATVPDLFLNLRRIKDERDRNKMFMDEINRLSENIIYRLQEQQIK